MTYRLKLALILLLRNLGWTAGQFGVPKAAKTIGVSGEMEPVDSPNNYPSFDQPQSQEDEIDEVVTESTEKDSVNDETIKAAADIKAMEKLQKDWPEIPDQLLFDLGALIHSVKEKMNKDGVDSALFSEALEVSAELSSALKAKEIVLGMEKALESMKKIDKVFENIHGVDLVISDMKSKGFIETDAQEKKFRERPDLLKLELTKTSYLTFVALAFAGKYIER
ncbi:hypothetical protein FisN_19Hh109 [Fistulifera solaris]|jgi:hypothetical protein|uniref:Uncharacterized protein n=1 Tax=Fistulifera solaris TaxID=1519565 RepID=A0A1Z5K092_FISSO|nr:hypothetical protein FisN_19Hh109 [Fistulifera solaris]|eukprot:GAX19532.1 hypothetical protein FisN_19Hh109 [Fistulifera solaris]